MNIRYFKVLVQEMSFNLDIGFVEGVIGLFGDLEQREWTTKELFELDYNKVSFVRENLHIDTRNDLMSAKYFTASCNICGN